MYDMNDMNEFECKQYHDQVNNSKRNVKVMYWLAGFFTFCVLFGTIWTSVWDNAPDTSLQRAYDLAFIEVAGGAKAANPDIDFNMTGVARIGDNAYYHIRLSGRGEVKTAWVIFAKSDSPRQRYTITTW